MMDTKKQIISALKSNGFSLRQVSVRSNENGYALTIHNLEISKKHIEDLVKKFENLEYDHADGDLLNCSTVVTVEKDKKFSDFYKVSYDLIEVIDKALNDLNQDLHQYLCYYVMKNSYGDIELISNNDAVSKEAGLFQIFTTENGKDWLYRSIADAIYENIIDRAYFLSEELKKK